MGQYSKYKLFYKEEYDGEQWVPVIPLEYYGAMIEENSTDCGYIEPIYEWQVVSQACVGVSLYELEYEFVSYDNGETWTSTGKTRKGRLIDPFSTQCGAQSVDCRTMIYTTTDEQPIEIWNSSPANVVSNTYEDGVGKIVFDADLLQIDENGTALCGVDFFQGESFENEADKVTSIFFPSCLTNTDCGHFSYMDSLETIYFPDSMIGIGIHSFQGCVSLNDVYIENGLEWIGSWSFAHCGDFTIHYNGTKEQWNAIAKYSCWNADSRITIICTDGVLPDADKIIWYQSLGGRKIGGSYRPGGDVSNNSYFDDWGRIEYFNTLTSLSFGSQYLTNIIYPDSITEIKSMAGSSALTSFNISSHITTIGENAFSSCVSLSSITIPNNVTSIGEGAFTNCTSLSSITIPNSVTTSIGNNMFYYCTELSSVNIGSNVPSIGNYAFYRCYKLSGITIPNNVTSIGNNAFQECSGMTSVNIGNGLTSIGEYAFAYCDELTSVVIPNNVTSIGKNAFNSCISLETVTIGSGMTEILHGVFSNCSSLVVVNIPTSVRSIGSAAFSNCDSFEINYAGTKSQWNSIQKGQDWNYGSTISVHCTDGTIDY